MDVNHHNCCGCGDITVMNPNKFMAGMIALVVVVLIAGALLGGAYWGHAELKAVPAKFKVGDCYRATPPLHRWRKADGMVFDMDATDYLIVDAHMMGSKRPIEPAYVGAEVYITAFDRNNDVVSCPGRW